MPENNTFTTTDVPAELTWVEEYSLTNAQETEVMRLAAVGMRPADIALALELPPGKLMEFVKAAQDPANSLFWLIASGRATGKATPQIKLQEAAAAGNLEAIRLLQKAQAQNRFNDLLIKMDEDEYTP